MLFFLFCFFLLFFFFFFFFFCFFVFFFFVVVVVLLLLFVCFFCCFFAGGGGGRGGGGFCVVGCGIWLFYSVNALTEVENLVDLVWLLWPSACQAKPRPKSNTIFVSLCLFITNNIIFLPHVTHMLCHYTTHGFMSLYRFHDTLPWFTAYPKNSENIYSTKVRIVYLASRFTKHRP